MLNTIMIASVLELECLVSKQWQQQIRGFQAGRVQLEKNHWVKVYTGISGYTVGPHTLHIQVE